MFLSLKPLRKNILTTYVGEILKSYSNERIWDEELLAAFQQQFEGWT